jgi:hypothetical protein
MGAKGKLGQECQSVRPTKGLGIRGAILNEEKKQESVLKMEILTETQKHCFSRITDLQGKVLF